MNCNQDWSWFVTFPQHWIVQLHFVRASERFLRVCLDEYLNSIRPLPSSQGRRNIILQLGGWRGCWQDTLLLHWKVWNLSEKGTRALIKLHCSCEHELVGISTKFYNFRVKDNIFAETPIRLALKTIARTLVRPLDFSSFLFLIDVINNISYLTPQNT